MTRALLALALVAACSKPGEKPEPEPDPAAAWRADLKTFATELPARHKNLYFKVTETELEAAVDALDARLPTLRQSQAMVGIMRLAAMIGDGHTGAWWESRLPRMRTPLQLFVFSDGVFVTDAPADHAWAIGGKLVAVGGRPIDPVIATLTEAISHDNDAQVHAQLPDRLTDPMHLDGFDLADEEGRIAYRIGLADGTTRDLVLGPAPWRAQAPAGKDVPLGRRGRHLAYWNDYVADQKLLYFQYNACVDHPDSPLARLIAGTLGFIDQNPVEKVVIDLRSNGGGNSMLLWGLIEGLAERKTKVYALIGRHTFSSAVLNAIELDRKANAVLVGEPTGGAPSHYGEVQTFELPALSMRVQYSTKYFENPEYPGDSLEPEILAAPTAADHFAGGDRALEAIFAD